MVKENTMKQTEIGLLPEDWEVVKLGNILSYYKLGGNYVTSDLPNQSPLIKMGNIGRGKINISKLEYIIGNINSADLLKYGDLLFNTRNTLELVGKVSIWRKELPEAYYNSNLLKLVFKPQFVSSNFYINAIFNDKRTIKQLSDIATGTTSVAAIYTRDLLDIQIPLPPLPEQEAIAEALSDADAWIESLEKLIAKKRLIKQGAMQELLSPKADWEVKKLGEVTESFSGGTPNTSIDIYYNGDISFITSGELNQQRIKSTENTITQLGLDNSSAKLVNENSLLIAMYGATAGVVAINKISGAINQAVLAVISKKNYSVEFLYYFFDLKKEYIIKTYTQGGQPNLSGGILKNIEISFPSLTEQTRIATILSDMDAELEALEAQLGKARKVKQGMMQELLTGRVRLV